MPPLRTRIPEDAVLPELPAFHTGPGRFHLAISISDEETLKIVGEPTAIASPCRTVTTEEVDHLHEFGWVQLKGSWNPDVVRKMLGIARHKWAMMRTAIRCSPAQRRSQMVRNKAAVWPTSMSSRAQA